MHERAQEMHQIGALPFLVNADGSIEVCLITSRGGSRWIIPKGNPISGLAPHEVAAQEALEEAGLVGQADRDCLGTFTFNRHRDGRETNCSVDVYALKVERQLKRWNEMGQRSVLRCNVEVAMSLVSEPNLAILIRRYADAKNCLRTG